jgi:hypothetical protein
MQLNPFLRLTFHHSIITPSHTLKRFVVMCCLLQCPAGMFPAANNICRPCKEGFYCPPSNSVLEDTTTRCPGQLFSKAGAASLDNW